MKVYFNKIQTLLKVQKVQNVLSDSGPCHKAQKQVTAFNETCSFTALNDLCKSTRLEANLPAMWSK